MKRNIFIGLDGVPYRLIEQFTANDIMPNLGRIINNKNSCFTKMKSGIPDISSVAWSSIITGKNPGEHGIYGFTDVFPNTYRVIFPNYLNLKAKPFWKFNNADISVIINVPSTYPVSEMNGVHISGFVSLDINRSIYPEEVLGKLQGLNYKVDVDASKAKTMPAVFFKDLDKVLETRIAAYRFLWDYVDWKNFMFVFTGTDRLSHFFWSAYEDKNHEYREEFIKHFRKIDECIGEIFDRKQPEDNIILLSDHGFESVENDIYINNYLKKFRFLKFKNDTPKSINDITEDSAAFCLDPGRIYINEKGKFPRGCVEPSDRDKVIKELSDFFMGIKINEKQLIDKIYYNDDVYKGPFKDIGPDLVLMSNPGFALRGSLKSQVLYDKQIFTGKHTYEDAFFVFYSEIEKVTPEKNFSVENVLDLCKISNI